MDIVSVFRRAAVQHAGQPFASDATTTVDYRTADKRTDVIAGALIDAGLTGGEPLGLCAPDSIDLLLTIIGVWKAGGLPALIDPRTPAPELPYFVGDVDAKLVVSTPDLRQGLDAAGARQVIDLAGLARTPAGGGSPPLRHTEDSPLYLSYTSGTTGRPKGAMLRSGPVTLGTACIAGRLGIGRRDVLLATTPTSSSFQLVSALMPAMHTGASVALASGLSPGQVVALARARKATVLVAYPLTLADVVNHADVASCGFRMALSGGSPLAPRIKRDYAERLGIPLAESYGQSELGGFMALGRPSADERALAGYVGPALPDRPSLICDEDGREVPAGELGEVTIPHGYFAGYKNKPGATAEALRGGMLHTDDLGVADEDGWIKVLGRTRERADAVRRGGFLRDVEDAYYDHPDVKHAALVSSSQGGIEAFVELLPGCVTSHDELAEFAAGRVPAGLRPGRTTVLDRMPRSFSGKADRRRLEQEVCT